MTVKLIEKKNWRKVKGVGKKDRNIG